MIAVNLFLFVGCWFMVDSEFKWSRVRALYGTVIIYTVPLTIIAILSGANPSTKDIARGFLPFIGRALWFASAYISLMLLAPWLKRALELEERSLRKLVIISTLLVSGVCTLPDAQDTYICHFLWFIYVFILIGYLKKHLGIENIKNKNLPYIALLVGIIIYSALVGGIAWEDNLGKLGAVGCRLSTQYLMDFKTLPNFIASILIFYFFLHLDIGSKGWINFLAKSSFAVYVIHQTPAFYPMLWTKLCRAESWLNSSYYLLYVVVVVLAIYIFGVVVDSLRRVIIRTIITKEK